MFDMLADQGSLLNVVAEGVDSEELAATLAALHCDEAQGFLFGRPVAFDEMTGLLAQATFDTSHRDHATPVAVNAGLPLVR